MVHTKISQIFQYLKDYNNKRNPIKRSVKDYEWYLKLSDLPDHPKVKIGVFNERDGELVGDDFILKVQRPNLTKPPDPPIEVRDWLNKGWERADGNVDINPSRNMLDANGKAVIEQFSDNQSRVDALKRWKTSWQEWARNELPTLSTAKLFEKLFSLHGTIEREAEKVELILGEGIISQCLPNGEIYHPIIFQKLQLEFDPETPLFIIRETDHPVELYTALFLEIPNIDSSIIIQYRQNLEELSVHPCGGSTTTGFLKKLVQSLSSNGEFVETGEPLGTSDHIRIGRDRYIFMRNRALGFTTAIDSILEDIKTRQEFPPALLNVIGVEAPPVETEEVGLWDNLSGGGNEDTETLFSKSANPEQLKIAKRLEKHGCVLVQGPPGTGKTHTIANLIGHLLAQGKRILVTSHTTKALRVLREHIVEELRPCCVSVLDRDTDSRKQLENAITNIDEKLSSLNPGDLEQKAKSVRQDRNKIVKELIESRHNLMLARGDEYRDLVVAGNAYSPSNAARLIANGRGKDDWIPDQVSIDKPLPLTYDELQRLYLSNNILTSDEEKELKQNKLPDPAELISPDDFDKLLSKKRSLIEVAKISHGEKLWVDCTELTVTCSCGVDNRLKKNWLGFSCRCKECKADIIVDSGQIYSYKSLGIEALSNLSLRVKDSIETISIDDDSRWMLKIVQDGMQGVDVKQTWINLINLIEEISNHKASAAEYVIAFAPEIATEVLSDDTGKIFEKIIKHLEKGKTLSWFTLLKNKEWKSLIDICKINNQRPQKAEHFRALSTCAKLSVLRGMLKDRWSRMITSAGGPAIESKETRPEEICSQYAIKISLLLNWHDKIWLPIEGELLSAGLRFQEVLNLQPPVLTEYGITVRLHNAINSLSQIIEARQNRLELESINIQLKKLLEKICLIIGEDTSLILNELKKSIERESAETYREIFTKLIKLKAKLTHYSDRCEILKRLECVAPIWASLIRYRKTFHNTGELPGEPNKAWLWRQLNGELDSRSSKSIPEMQKNIENLSRDLERITTELIYHLAWGFQLNRLSGQIGLRQALKTWLFVVGQLGAGTGRKVPRLTREAKKLMAESQNAVPVWVMPLSRVVENYNPAKSHFDVVIIDEASQSDPLGLIAFYMAEKVIVVGDHEQVSPDAVGVTNETSFGLIDLHLTGFNNRMLFLPTSSVYELSRAGFGATIQLVEHFRCVPDIIQFSNYLSYDGKIKPLRDATASELLPHTVAYRVEGATSDNKVNNIEAIFTASLIAAALEQPEYDGKEFGVISLVGEEQAFRIEKTIREHLPPAEIESRRLVCGNPPQFQGDERHVMFLSMVDTPTGDGPLGLRRAGPNDMWRKRYNVAASRAKDQMWLVYSLNHAIDLQPGDIRRRLIEHMLNPQSLANQLKHGADQTESEFERLVCARLINEGFKVTPQWWVGKYRIDLVVSGIVSGKVKSLAVECDGDRYHTLDNLPEDMARQAILERLGWTFTRIRGSEFFREPDRAMQKVFDKLKDMGINPHTITNNDENLQSELKDRVILRAAQIRKEWEDGTYVFTKSTPNKIYDRQEELTSKVSSEEVAGKESTTTDAHKGHLVDICMHLNTGKYYLCIGGTSDGARLTVITPEGRLLNMDVDMFDEIVEYEIKQLLDNNMITKQQLSAYLKYIKQP